HSNRFTAVKAWTVDAHFLLGEKPAHCQRLKPSLPVPALSPANCNQVLRRQIREWRKRFDVVGARVLPYTGQAHIDQLAQCTALLPRRQVQPMRQLDIVRGATMLDEPFEDRVIHSV